MQVLLSFVTTIIAAVVTYLSATDNDQDTSAASGAQARDSAERLGHPKHSVFAPSLPNKSCNFCTHRA